MRSWCWIWQGGLNGRGYAQMGIRRPVWRDGEFIGKQPRNVLVHRLVLLEFFGIPLETVEAAAHQCSTKRCINPEHVAPDTFAGNTQFYYTVERPMRLALAQEGGGSPMREPGEDG